MKESDGTKQQKSQKCPDQHSSSERNPELEMTQLLKHSPYSRTWVQLPKCHRHGSVPLESQYRGQETEWSLSSLASQSNWLGRLQDKDKSYLKGSGLCSWEWYHTQNCAHAHASTNVLAHIHILKRIKTKKEPKYSIIGKRMHYYFSIYTMGYYKTI